MQRVVTSSPWAERIEVLMFLQMFCAFAQIAMFCSMRLLSGWAMI